MLFNSYEFLFIFLPILLIIWQLVGLMAKSRLPLLLLGASVIFYALWGLPFFVLLLFMICMNYGFGLALQNAAETPAKGGLSKKGLLAVALVLNLAPLCYFKYSTFIISNINVLLGTNVIFAHPGLPLGISFYTFLQIAWLVTVYRGQINPRNFTGYALFASCFPYVISGPIVRWQEVGDQLAGLDTLKAENAAPGLAFFVMGLAKKVLLADSIAAYANSVFNAAEKGFPLTSAEAWFGSLAYTFQLYFDFSGYTDMAVGIGLILGLKLPDNFNSPYKSTGIVDFWRRWHITLSSWLRDFLYIPLGGSRQGTLVQYPTLFLTMLLGGVWHGAGWTFIVWGAMHGAMLTANHYFRSLIKGRPIETILRNKACVLISIAFTFICVNYAWVVFRADSMAGAIRVYDAMGQIFSGGLSGSFEQIFANNYVRDWNAFALLALCALISFVLPNTRQIIEGAKEALPFPLFKPSNAWAATLAVLAFCSLVLMSRKSVFLYFQF